MATILGNPEALVAEVIRRAQHRAAEIAEDARRRADAILEDANKESESIRRQSEEAAERRVAAVIRRNSARAEMEAMRRFITLREEPIDRVWSAAEERLRQLVQQATYLEILKHWAFRAARELAAPELVLAADRIGHQLLSEETLHRWSQEAGVQFRSAPDPVTTWGGLLAVSGRLRFDATFPTQLAIAKDILRERVFQALSKEDH